MMMHWCSFFFLKKNIFDGDHRFSVEAQFFDQMQFHHSPKREVYIVMFCFFLFDVKKSEIIFCLFLKLCSFFLKFILFCLMMIVGNDRILFFLLFNTLMTNYLDCCPLNCGPNPKVFSAHLELADLVRLRHQISQL